MTNAHKKIFNKNYRRKHNLSVEYDIILVVLKHAKVETKSLILLQALLNVVRALHRYRRGHGFDSSPFRPEFFQVSSFQLL